MNVFEFVKPNGDDFRRWVRTPFPVSQNVWASFAFRTLPAREKFNESGFPVPIVPEYLHGVWTREIMERPTYLNRWSSEPVDEIANGQVGEYYKFAYLPHGDRQGLQVHDWGLIHAADPSYLEMMEAEFADNPQSRLTLLQQLEGLHKKTIKTMMDLLKGLRLPSDDTGVHYSILRRNLFYEANDRGMIPLYPAYGLQKGPQGVGNLPVCVGLPKHELVAQTTLDFLRAVDEEILGRRKTEIDDGGFLEIYSGMTQRYSGFLSE